MPTNYWMYNSIKVLVAIAYLVLLLFLFKIVDHYVSTDNMTVGYKVIPPKSIK